MTPEERWNRVARIRELINITMRDLNGDSASMSIDGERSMMWLAVEVAGVSTGEIRDELLRLYEQILGEMAQAGHLLLIAPKGRT